MKGAIGNAFILNMVITFIIIFFMLLIGSVAYSKAYKVNKFLLDSLVDYVEYFNTVSNQKSICFSKYCDNDEKVIVSWRDKVNDYLARSGYLLTKESNTCRSRASEGYRLARNNTVGDYDYCIYQKEYYALDKTDDIFTKKRFSYKVVSYMKFDFPIIGEFIKLPITSESKVILNFH